MKTEMDAITKKTYHTFDLQSKVALNNLYVQYFSKNDCSSLLNLLNRFSVADGILQSGGTSVILEYKSRELSVSQYDTTLLEKLKYDKMKEASKLFDAPALYIVEFDECVLVYQLDFKQEQEVDYLDAPATRGSGYAIKKAVYHLPILTADIIISKKTYERATSNQLKRFIEGKRNGSID